MSLGTHSTMQTRIVLCVTDVVTSSLTATFTNNKLPHVTIRETLSDPIITTTHKTHPQRHCLSSRQYTISETCLFWWQSISTSPCCPCQVLSIVTWPLTHAMSFFDSSAFVCFIKSRTFKSIANVSKCKIPSTPSFHAHSKAYLWTSLPNLELDICDYFFGLDDVTLFNWPPHRITFHGHFQPFPIPSSDNT